MVLILLSLHPAIENKPANKKNFINELNAFLIKRKVCTPSPEQAVIKCRQRGTLTLSAFEVLDYLCDK